MLAIPAILLNSVTIFGYINHRYLKLPLTVGLAIIALLSTILITLVDNVAPNLGVLSVLRHFLESIDFNEIPSDFQYKSIGDLKKQFKVCNLIGFKDPSGNFIINPKDEIEIVPSCKILVLGSTDEIKKLNQIFGI